MSREEHVTEAISYGQIGTVISSQCHCSISGRSTDQSKERGIPSKDPDQDQDLVVSPIYEQKPRKAPAQFKSKARKSYLSVQSTAQHIDHNICPIIRSAPNPENYPGVYRSKAKSSKEMVSKRKTDISQIPVYCKVTAFRHVASMKLPDENAYEEEPTQKHGQNHAEPNKCVVE